MKTASVEVGNKRLLKLAAFLRKVPRKRFDYGSWVGMDWKGAQDLSCGTTGCAMGWGATMPEFRRLGLRLSKSYDGVPILGRKLGTEAATVLFGLDYSEADYLFMPASDGSEDNASAIYVAKKIEKFVKSRTSD